MFWHVIVNVCKTRPAQMWKCRDFVLLACDIFIACTYRLFKICLFVFLSCVSGVWLSLLCCLFPVTFLWWAQCYHCCGELLVTGYLYYMHAWIKVAPTPIHTLPFFPPANPWNCDTRTGRARSSCFWLTVSAWWCLCGQIMSLSDSVSLFACNHVWASCFFLLLSQ